MRRWYATICPPYEGHHQSVIGKEHHRTTNQWGRRLSRLLKEPKLKMYFANDSSDTKTQFIATLTSACRQPDVVDVDHQIQDYKYVPDHHRRFLLRDGIV